MTSFIVNLFLFFLRIYCLKHANRAVTPVCKDENNFIIELTGSQHTLFINTLRDKFLQPSLSKKHNNIC